MLYICQKLGGKWDKYSLLKILYFAERKHLAEYGRPVTGDAYIAMPYGPVPSNSYDYVKANTSFNRFFSIDGDVITSIETPDLDVLSDSDVECLDLSIEENKTLSFGQLKEKSHDVAYNWAWDNLGKNSTIPYVKIASAGGASAEMIEYIKLLAENENCQFNVD